MGKKIKQTGSINGSKSNVDQDNSSANRRKAVKNILAGSGLTIGAASSGQWLKPVVDAVVLPAHAQMSATVTLGGNANLSPITMQQNDQNTNSVLDFFVGPAHAASGPDLAGTCITMTISGDVFDIVIEFLYDDPIMFSGSAAGGAISGSGSGITVTGSADLGAATPTASGTISNASGNFGFNLSSGTPSCMPIEPTTTASPTTTMMDTTSAPTTTMMFTTASPTTTMMFTTASPTTTNDGRG